MAVPIVPGTGVICAEPGDLARAGGQGAPSLRAVQEAYEQAAPLLRGLRRLEGFADPVEVPEAITLPPGATVLLSAAAMPMARIAGLLLAGAEQGLLWKPAPSAAASAHVLMRRLSPALGPRVSLVHGDHDSGALLAGRGGVIWASDAEPPMPVRAHVPATGPRRP